jgi:hypothetical protein
LRPLRLFSLRHTFSVSVGQTVRAAMSGSHLSKDFFELMYAPELPALGRASSTVACRLLFRSC